MFDFVIFAILSSLSLDTDARSDSTLRRKRQRTVSLNTRQTYSHSRQSRQTRTTSDEFIHDLARFLLFRL